MENAPKYIGLLSSASMLVFFFVLVCLNPTVHCSVTDVSVKDPLEGGANESVFEEACDQQHQDISLVQRSSKKISSAGQGAFAAAESASGASSLLNDAEETFEGLVDTATSAVTNNSLINLLKQSSHNTVVTLLKQVAESKGRQEPVAGGGLELPAVVAGGGVVQAPAMPMAPVSAPVEMAINPAQYECAKGKTIVPFIFLCFIMAIGTWLYIRNLDPDPIMRALSLGVMSCFVWEFTFSSILVESFPISDALGMGPGFSGWVIGIFKVGTFVSSVCVWFWLKRHNHLWRRGKLGLVCSMSFQCFNAVTITACAFYAGTFNKLAPNGLDVVSSPLASNFLILGRFLQGCGAVNGFITQQFAHLLPPQDRALQQMRLNVAWSFGLAAGPMVAPLVRALGAYISCEFSGPMFGATMLVSCMIPFCAWFCIVYAYPNLENVPEQKIEKVGEEHEEWQGRTVVVGCCIALQGVFHLATAQLEAAMIYLLQDKYNYSTAYTGCAAAIIFFGCVVVYHVYYRMRKNYPFDQVLRFLAFSFFFSSILIHPLNWPDGPRLLVGCMLAFPPLIMGGALIFGIMQNHCLPDSYRLNVSNVTLIQFVVNDFFGRGFGPFFSRGLISRWGQQGYAFENLILGGVAIFLLEIIILRRCDRHLYVKEKDTKKQLKTAQGSGRSQSVPRPTYIIESPKSEPPTFQSNTVFSPPKGYDSPPATTSTVEGYQGSVHVPRRLAEQRAAAGLGSFPTSPGAVVGPTTQSGISRATSATSGHETLPPMAAGRASATSEPDPSPSGRTGSDKGSQKEPRRGRPLQRDNSQKGSDTPGHSTETLRLGSWTIRSHTRTPQLSFTGPGQPT